MHSDQAMLTLIQNERNPKLADLEREHSDELAQMRRATGFVETPREYVIRQILESRFR